MKFCFQAKNAVSWSKSFILGSLDTKNLSTQSESKKEQHKTKFILSGKRIKTSEGGCL